MQTIAEIKSTLNKLQTPTTDRATKTADKLKSSEGVYDGSGGPGGEAVSRTAGGDSFLEVGEVRTTNLKLQPKQASKTCAVVIITERCCRSIFDRSNGPRIQLVTG